MMTRREGRQRLLEASGIGVDPLHAMLYSYSVVVLQCFGLLAILFICVYLCFPLGFDSTLELCEFGFQMLL